MKQILLAALLAVVAATAVFTAVQRKKNRKYDDAPLKVTELPVNAGFGIFIWCCTAALCVMLPGSDVTSGYPQAFKANIVLAAAGGMILGAVSFAFSLVRLVAAYDDEIVEISAFGRCRSFAWKDIRSVRQVQSNRLRFTDAEGRSLSVGGKVADHRSFVSLASKKIPSDAAGVFILRDLLQKWKML